MRPMTIVVVREEPAGGSEAGVSVFAGAAEAVVAGARRRRGGGAGLGRRRGRGGRRGSGGGVAEAGAAGLAVDWAKPADAARRITARAAESAERRFMAGETIGRAGARQAQRARRMNRARDLLRLDAAVFLSGAALMGLEIVGSRVLAPVFGTSLFVWGALITTFLAALAAGYALGGRLADRRPGPAPCSRACSSPPAPS